MTKLNIFCMDIEQIINKNNYGFYKTKTTPFFV